MKLIPPLANQMPCSGLPLISVVIPVHNEALGLSEFHRRLTLVLEQSDLHCEIWYINDGSRDNSTAVLAQLRQCDPRVGLIELSRRFGKEIALSAGLDHIHGAAVILIDADLQDPPEYIPQMIAAWQDGFDIVAMRRTNRSVDSLFKRTSAKGFYWFLSRLSHIDMPREVGDFRLLSRRSVDALKQLPERNRYMKGLYAWIGFSYKELDYERETRHAGRTQWPLHRLVGLALDGLTAFSMAPLRLASIVGVLTALGAFVFGLIYGLKALIWGDPVQGFPTLMVAISLLGGVQLMAIGILGEYVGRMFVETKQRPLYLSHKIEQPQQTNTSALAQSSAQRIHA